MKFKQIGEPEQAQVFQQVPVNVREYASKYHLGTPLMPYRDNRLVLLSLVGRVLLVVGLIGATGYSIKEYIDGIILDHTMPLPPTNYYERIFQLTQQELLWGILFLALYTLTSTLFLWRYYREAQQKLYFCQQGLLRVGGKKEEAVRWDEVIDISGCADRSLILYKKGSGTFVISASWPRNEKLNQRIAHILADRLLPQIIEWFEKGIPISFGALIIVREGIRQRGKLLSWSDLEDIQDQHGRLAIKSKGKWHYHTLIKAPLISDLVKHILHSRLVGMLTTYAKPTWEKLPETGE